MKQIHNSKERMPTILPGDLAEAWLYKDLSDQDILVVCRFSVLWFRGKIFLHFRYTSQKCFKSLLQLTDRKK